MTESHRWVRDKIKEFLFGREEQPVATQEKELIRIGQMVDVGEPLPSRISHITDESVHVCGPISAFMDEDNHVSYDEKSCTKIYPRHMFTFARWKSLRMSPLISWEFWDFNPNTQTKYETRDVVHK